MKRKDLIIIIGVAVIAGIISFIASSAIFGTPQKYSIKVPVVEKINPNFPTPATDEDYKAFFNDKALNPTQLIQIGGNPNNQPFQSGNGH